VTVERDLKTKIIVARKVRYLLAINVADLGTGVGRMKYFTEREFSGIFSLEGEFCVFKKGIPGCSAFYEQIARLSLNFVLTIPEHSATSDTCSRS